jgi:hypothetical protein
LNVDKWTHPEEAIPMLAGLIGVVVLLGSATANSAPDPLANRSKPSVTIAVAGDLLGPYHARPYSDVPFERVKIILTAADAAFANG